MPTVIEKSNSTRVQRPTLEAGEIVKQKTVYARDISFDYYPDTKPSNYISYFVFWIVTFAFLKFYGDSFWFWMVKSTESPYLASFIMLSSSLALYWVHAGLLAFSEWAGWFGTKIQPDKQIGIRGYWKLAKQVAFNQLFVSVPMGMMYSEWAQWQGCHAQSVSNNILKFLGQLAIFLLVEEFIFYYSHRALHHPRIYRHIHKQHHEFTAPVGLAAIYAHPFEHFFSNMLPLFLGPVITQAHPLFTSTWIMLATINTVNSHSGYVFPPFPSPINHDWHHYFFVENYGLMGLLDAIHGTDKSYRQFLSTRHLVTKNARVQ